MTSPLPPALRDNVPRNWESFSDSVTDSFRVIVPREAVGERCELMHEVFLLDIDIDLADVTDVDEVVRQLARSSVD